MIGKGKYDLECSAVRMRTLATGVIVIVIGGDRGSGFSMQAPPEMTAKLPGVLRHMADEIEADLKPSNGPGSPSGSPPR